jgi:hypothetical protein
MNKRLKKKKRKAYNNRYSKNNIEFTSEKERKLWVRYITNA